jgi:hypothetical protein
LLGPFLLTWLFAAASGNSHYWLLFSVMLGVSLTLDVGLYSWLIDYQPRWLTLLLAACEFMLLKWIVEWPYPLEIRLRTRQALLFYLLCWLLIWLTLHVLLPRYRSRWAEENGRITYRRPGWLQPNAARLRRMYGAALGGLSAALLPWAVAGVLRPNNAVMTGLLLNERAQLADLAAATSAAQGRTWRAPAGAIGWLALHGRWPVLPIYQIAWLIAATVVLLTMQMLWPDIGARRVLMVSLILIALPLSGLLLGVGLLGLLGALWSGRHPARRLRRPLSVSLALVAIVSWGLAWSRLDRAALLYLDQGTWQALTWMQQSTAADAKIIAPAHLSDTIVGLAGRTTSDRLMPGALELTSGAACASGEIRFRHGAVCIVAQPSIKESSR